MQMMGQESGQNLDNDEQSLAHLHEDCLRGQPTSPPDTTAGATPTGISNYIKGRLFLTREIDNWMSQVHTMGVHVTSQPATPARVLKVLKMTAEVSLYRTFTSGCLVASDLQTIDEKSKRYAVQLFEDQPSENILEVLAYTRDQLFALKHLLQFLIGHDKIAQWTGVYTTQGNRPAPSVILGKDLLLVMACLHTIQNKIQLKKETHNLECSQPVAASQEGSLLGLGTRPTRPTDCLVHQSEGQQDASQQGQAKDS